ncbi:hypothetical protein [Roseovarius sp. M141]|uniref:hypothetical protein n=1 Tax=Roseovarius sp. M141 TaxID=2583806 RepID=UPI0020CC553C|nr:hypothetical protein [Roseovarius sp. M141]MCQ0092505.1 hypothetical protein [Roseovarius sp. M141]
MKPNFALTFSAQGVSLLHRSDKGWTRVGTVSLDDDDMPAAFSALRDRAGRLSGDLNCKIVIPNDQIKYLSIETEGDPEPAVRAALDGATPYPVEDLEYDWTAVDGVIQIAAVALDTLAEAEAFASEHGFDAISFAAIPDGAAFGGEPFFGLTRHGATTLPNGTVVDRDDSAIRIIGDAQIPAADAPTPPPESPKPKTVPAGAPVASAAAQAVADAPPAPKRAAPDSGDVAPAKSPISSEAPQKKADSPAPAATLDPEPTKSQSPEKPDSAPDSAKGAAAQSDAASPGTPKPEKPKSHAEAAAPKDAKPPVPKPDTPAAAPVAESASGSMAAFSSMRATRSDDAAKAPTTAPPLPSPASDDVTDPARLAELAASLQPDPSVRLDRDAAENPAPTGKTGHPGRSKDRKAEAAADRAARPTRENEKQRMTVFGDRQSAVRGKPRFLGLILTAILLLFLVGVAAWASIFLEDGLSRFFGRGDDIKLANVPATDETEPGDEATNALDGTGDTVGEDNVITPLPEIAALPDGRDQPEVVALPDLPSPLAPSEALARYAATGIWQMAPTSPDIPVAGAPLADIYEVSVDPGLGLGDPANMPRRTPDARDTRPETPGDPPPAGSRFDFDARGLVRATPDGAMTPQGVRVFAGSPPMTPPKDMAQSVTVTATPETAEPNLAPGTTFTGDPALAGTRPRLRPESILARSGPQAAPDEAPPETREDGENTVTGTDENTRTAEDDAVVSPSLAMLRPQTRPARMTTAAATLQTAQDVPNAPLVEGAALTRAIAEATAAGTVAVDPEEEADQDSFDNATPQAVTASLTPLRRPGDFKSTVARTRAKAAAQPVPAAQRLKPSIPSSASVSRQATAKDAINLRKVNLIGVYGSSSSRRALVRLGNGRYQKVRVGDRLDGGQVAAIGDSELRYIKRGKNVVLRIPQG